MERFVIIGKGFQPLTIITKCSILDVAAALDPPLSASFRFVTSAPIFYYLSNFKKVKQKVSLTIIKMRVFSFTGTYPAIRKPAWRYNLKHCAKSIILSHFVPMLSFYTHWKYQKNHLFFLLFSVVIKWEHCLEMG